MKILEREKAIKGLNSVFSKDGEVLAAFLFGSLALKGQSAHDVDIAILLDFQDAWTRARKIAVLSVELAKRLGVNEEKVNIVDLNKAPLALRYAALSQGICLKANPAQEEFKKELLRDYPDFMLRIEKGMVLKSNPKPDIALIQSRIEELRRNVNYLTGEVVSQPSEAIVLDYKSLLAMERATHRAIEAMLDICRHLVSVHDLGLVENYGEYPKRLNEAGFMSDKLAKGLKELAGLRNILVHRYLKVDHYLLYKVINELTGEIYPDFMEWVEILRERFK